MSRDSKMNELFLIICAIVAPLLVLLLFKWLITFVNNILLKFDTSNDNQKFLPSRAKNVNHIYIQCDSKEEAYDKAKAEGSEYWWRGIMLLSTHVVKYQEEKNLSGICHINVMITITIMSLIIESRHLMETWTTIISFTGIASNAHPNGK